jgi:hypothetical protein
MPTTILPPTFIVLLLAFRESFTAPSFGNFVCLVAGWLHCLGRHTITSVALASGAVGQRHLSVFHRFFGRAQWSLDGLGQVLFTLALRWIPTSQPLLLLADDTLAHKSGKSVSLAAMHHDPLLSTAKRPFFSFGHVWVVLALWVPLPMGPLQGFALPIRVRLYTSSQRGGHADAPSRPTQGRRLEAATAAHEQRDRRTKLELLRAMTDQVAQWVPERTIDLAVDSAYAGRTTLEHRPANVQVISRLRPDAALWAVSPQRQPGQKGRPRRRGERLPTPKVMAAACRDWQRLAVTLYGRPVVTQIVGCTALWYAALRDQPVQVLLVRDPRERRQLDVFFCTDLSLSAAAILETYAHRWTIEVTFHDAKQFLGFEDPQSQTCKAVQRTAPLALVVYDLVLLWSAAQWQQPGSALTWVDRPWYRRKQAPSFQDMLTALRRVGWRQALSAAPSVPRHLQKALVDWPDAVLATA